MPLKVYDSMPSTLLQREMSLVCEKPLLEKENFPSSRNLKIKIIPTARTSHDPKSNC